VKRKKRSKRRSKEGPSDRYQEMGRELPPSERLRRYWRLKRYLRKLEEDRDSKSRPNS
jgi:hypothetical protein